jgi:cell division protein FtsB
VADNLVTSIRRMVGSSFRPGQRTLLEHAAMQAADEIERLRATITELRAEVQRLEQVTRG